MSNYNIEDRTDIVIKEDGIYRQTISCEYVAPFSTSVLSELNSNPSFYKKNFFDFSFVHKNIGRESIYLQSGTNGSYVTIAVQVLGWFFTTVEIKQRSNGEVFLRPLVGKKGTSVSTKMFNQSLNWTFGEQTDFKVMLAATMQRTNANSAIEAKFDVMTPFVYLIHKDGNVYFLPLFNLHEDNGHICLGGNNINDTKLFGSSPISKMISLIRIMQDGTWNTDLCYDDAIRFYTWNGNLEPKENTFPEFKSKLPRRIGIPQTLQTRTLYSFSDDS